MKTFTRYFLQGFLILLPIILTAYLFYFVFITVDKFGKIFLGVFIEEKSILTGAGVVLTLGLFSTVGYFSSRWFGVRFFNWVERQFLGSRVTRGIYGAIRDTLSALFVRKRVLNRVALVDFPGQNCKRIGFVTQDPPSFSIEGEEQMAVYFPHSFQISGNLLVVPKKNVRFLEISGETALKMIMSAGIVKE